MRKAFPFNSTTMPTMKQVDEMITALADEFDFSEEQARVFLGLPREVKSKTPPKPKAEAKPKAAAKPKAEPKPKAAAKPTSETKSIAKTSTPRGPTAYQQFVKSESSKVKAELQRKHGDKLERGAVMKEVGAKWKQLSAAEKEMWKWPKVPK